MDGQLNVKMYTASKSTESDRRFITVETLLNSNTLQHIPEEAKPKKQVCHKRKMDRNAFWYRRQHQWVIGSGSPDNKMCSSLRAQYHKILLKLVDC